MLGLEPAEVRLTLLSSFDRPQHWGFAPGWLKTWRDCANTLKKNLWHGKSNFYGEAKSWMSSPLPPPTPQKSLPCCGNIGKKSQNPEM